jgi:solute carrier family 25 phosphate transporter 3
MIKWGISVLSAFFAAICACLCSQPGDMILTATYKGHGGHSHGAVNDAQSSDESSDKSFLLTVNRIYSKYGLAGFFMGLQARMAHVASIITSQLVLYDIVKAALGLPVTGSH